MRPFTPGPIINANGEVRSKGPIIESDDLIFNREERMMNEDQPSNFCIGNILVNRKMSDRE